MHNVNVICTYLLFPIRKLMLKPTIFVQLRVSSAMCAVGYCTIDYYSIISNVELNGEFKSVKIIYVR